jgi:alpha-ribazole phosphatase
MEIYLVRHTKPIIRKDICYGQTDIPIDASMFGDIAKNILQQLPQQVDGLYSSPLIRCSYLATYIREHKYPNIAIEYSNLLKEVHFGDWENKRWDDLPKAELDLWMNDFVNQKPPNGESFIYLHQRTKYFLNYLSKQSFSTIAIITHAGIIRSLTCHTQDIELKDAFSINCEYGSVIKLLL